MSIPPLTVEYVYEALLSTGQLGTFDRVVGVLEYQDELLREEGSWADSTYTGEEAQKVMAEYKSDIARGFVSNLTYRWRQRG